MTNEIFGKKIENTQKSLAIGGIGNLLNKTPEYEIKGGKKILNASYDNNKIFSDEFHNVEYPNKRHYNENNQINNKNKSNNGLRSI
jgi:hypothetical protein